MGIIYHIYYNGNFLGGAYESYTQVGKVKIITLLCNIYKVWSPYGMIKLS